MNRAGERTDTMRILDANFNRASEGLRVVEEYFRFCLDDAHLTSICKNLRHQLAETCNQISLDERNAARDTSADVGTTITTESESTRESSQSVALASVKRVQQALRCLEEFSKTICSKTAHAFEQLRYESYMVEKAISATESGQDQLAGKVLYVLVDGADSLDSFVAKAKQLVDAGVHIIQLRDKSLDDRELLDRARALKDMTNDTDTLFIMNDRPDLAVLSQADGVHVGQEELSVKDVQKVVGPSMLVGVSTHSVEQARQAVLDGANYIGVGPTFPSSTKSFDEFTGVELLKQVSAEVSIPAFAIGGINRTNLSDVLKSGFKRVAVGHDITAAETPDDCVSNYLAQLSG